MTMSVHAQGLPTPCTSELLVRTLEPTCVRQTNHFVQPANLWVQIWLQNDPRFVRNGIKRLWGSFGCSPCLLQWSSVVYTISYFFFWLVEAKILSWSPDLFPFRGSVSAFFSWFSSKRTFELVTFSKFGNWKLRRAIVHGGNFRDKKHDPARHQCATYLYLCSQGLPIMGRP